jgi:hypothetical protein
MKPAQVGARLGRDGHVLLARQPADLDERRGSSSRSFAAGSGACISAEPTRIASAPASSAPRPAPRADAALGDDDRSRGAVRDELELRAPVDRERREVAGVDPDHRRAEGHAPLELVRVVRLDERVEAELGRARISSAAWRRRGRGAGAAASAPPPWPCAGARSVEKKPFASSGTPVLARAARRSSQCRRSARRRGRRSRAAPARS